MRLPLTSNFTRAPHSAFWKAPASPKNLPGACANFGMPAMALLDRNGVYGSPRFHLAAKKAGIRAHIGSEITCTNGLTYPLLAASREGYQNLCRLVTRMKLRAPKGEGAATLEELAEFSRGLLCITAHPDERLLDIYGRQQSLRRTAAPSASRRRGAPISDVWNARAGSASRSSPPTSPPTPSPRSANCSTSSPASATKSRSPPRAACWSATTNGM